MFAALMALIKSPMVLIWLLTLIVVDWPLVPVILNVPLATPPPPLYEANVVFSLTVCRCKSPLLTLFCAALTAMPRFSAVVVESPSATIRLCAVEPLVSVNWMPLPAEFRLAVMPTWALAAAVLISLITSSTLSAPERSTVVPTPARSVMSSVPSVPTPLPPLRLLNSVPLRPANRAIAGDRVAARRHI